MTIAYFLANPPHANSEFRAGTLCALPLIHILILGVNHPLILLLRLALATWSWSSASSRPGSCSSLRLCGAIHLLSEFVRGLREPLSCLVHLLFVIGVERLFRV